MDNIRKNQIDHEFIAKAEAEVKKLDKGAKVFVIIGNNRNIRRSVDNSELDIIVLNIKEKEEVERRIEFTRRYRLQQEDRSYGKVQQRENRINEINAINRTKEGTEKVQDSKQKKDIKGVNSKKTKKRFTLSGKMKKIGAGLMALSMMGVIASETLTNRAENIIRYDKEFTSIIQVVNLIKSAAVQEYKQAVNKDNVELDIERIPAGDMKPEGVILTVTDLSNDEKTKYIKNKYEIINSNMHRKFAQILEAYLDVSEIAENAKMYNNEKISDSKKHKAIENLEKVEEITKEYDFEVKEN